jgi:gamma-glutamyltranspeptidase / glutathione hydrolase
VWTFRIFLVICLGAHAAGGYQQVVVTQHSQATEIGYEILKQGGNAFDAFVAATVAEYVVAEGTTSLAGPLGALLFDAKKRELVYLDAGFNTPLDPLQKWDPSRPTIGASALVPGSVAGLEAISQKYGKLPFRRVLQPAIELAEGGFPLTQLYAFLVGSSEYGGQRLKRSEYGLKTYFKDPSHPKLEGEILKLPSVAKLLKEVAAEGSGYMYRGAWASECIDEVKRQGGHLTPRDFSEYQIKWETPWRITYRDHEIYSPQIEGGLNTLLSLKVLEHTDVAKLGGHFSTNADVLETMLRVQGELLMESWLFDVDKISDSNFVASMFTVPNVGRIWSRVLSRLKPASSPSEGTHSAHIVVVDNEGNGVSGTNTIESFPWGEGIFVEGIPLTASGQFPFNSKLGQRRRSPLSMHVGLKNGKLHFLSGAFNASLVPAEFQFIVNIVDYRMSAKETVSFPRFGTMAWDFSTIMPSGGIWLDPRVKPDCVRTLTERGFNFKQDGYVDTGLGAVAIVGEDGSVKGASAPNVP